MSATQRANFGSVIVKLANFRAFDEFQRWVTTNPSLSVDAYRVSDYLSRNNAEQMAVFTRTSYVIGIIMALGALFGATKIMYAAVRARTREIGTLRALGFGGTSVTISVLLESTLLALIGAALGVLLAWLLFEGREVNSSGIFRLHVSVPLVALGLAWGALIALLGGLFPAIRAGKIAAATALRAA
jgi:putative ABC transport system permease protein